MYLITNTKQEITMRNLTHTAPPTHPKKQQQTVQSDIYVVILTIPLSASKCSQNTNQQRIWKLNFSNPSAIFMSLGQL